MTVFILYFVSEDHGFTSGWSFQIFAKRNI